MFSRWKSVTETQVSVAIVGLLLAVVFSLIVVAFWGDSIFPEVVPPKWPDITAIPDSTPTINTTEDEALIACNLVLDWYRKSDREFKSFWRIMKTEPSSNWIKVAVVDLSAVDAAAGHNFGARGLFFNICMSDDEWKIEGMGAWLR